MCRFVTTWMELNRVNFHIICEANSHSKKRTKDKAHHANRTSFMKRCVTMNNNTLHATSLVLSLICNTNIRRFWSTQRSPGMCSVLHANANCLHLQTRLWGCSVGAYATTFR
ncbi:hypothetical protein TRVL_09338 [Trypanosoma vivax]|nr:hypothetical protein TRVL_09338 [Trypanosoma vivax]